MARTRKKLGEILLSWGLLNANGLADGLEYATQHGKRIGEALVELELVSEEDVCKALATQFGFEYVELDKVVDQKNLDLIPTELIRKHQILPIGNEDGRLKIAITDPLDLETLDLLRFRLNTEITPTLAPPSRVKRFIDTFINTDSDELSKTMASIDQEAPEDQLPDELKGVDDSADDAPIVRLVGLVIGEAVRNRASDIHIEPMTNRVRVRYRVDGVCHLRDDIPKEMQAAITTRFKIISGMDIAEKRLPQDGRIKMQFGKQKIDFRVSALPSYHGESIVLRILRPESAQVGIEALGFEEDNNEIFQRVIRRPNGIFLVTGPTGSGKTTTLYSALQALNRPDKKIITAEDPVEYNFTGMNQCQVREEIGLSFSNILRAMLRQAPNIILVGEIRDKEVADVAIQAALTGHLVFSTLHTNDAPSAITRLIDMGVKPFLVASSIQAIMAQRLIRIICPDCAEPDPKPSKFLIKLLGITPEEAAGAKFTKGKGCKRCSGAGYRGRRGIFEMLVMNNELRDLAMHRASITKLRKAAIASGMRNLLSDGKLKVLRGITTLDEIARIAKAEGVIDEDVDLDQTDE